MLTASKLTYHSSRSSTSPSCRRSGRGDLAVTGMGKRERRCEGNVESCSEDAKGPDQVGGLKGVTQIGSHPDPSVCSASWRLESGSHGPNTCECIWAYVTGAMDEADCTAGRETSVLKRWTWRPVVWWRKAPTRRRWSDARRKNPLPSRSVYHSTCPGSETLWKSLLNALTCKVTHICGTAPTTQRPGPAGNSATRVAISSIPILPRAHRLLTHYTRPSCTCHPLFAYSSDDYRVARVSKKEVTGESRIVATRTPFATHPSRCFLPRPLMWFHGPTSQFAPSGRRATDTGRFVRCRALRVRAITRQQRRTAETPRVWSVLVLPILVTSKQAIITTSEVR